MRPLPGNTRVLSLDVTEDETRSPDGGPGPYHLWKLGGGGWFQITVNNLVSDNGQVHHHNPAKPPSTGTGSASSTAVTKTASTACQNVRSPPRMSDRRYDSADNAAREIQNSAPPSSQREPSFSTAPNVGQDKTAGGLLVNLAAPSSTENHFPASLAGGPPGGGYCGRSGSRGAEDGRSRLHGRRPEVPPYDDVVIAARQEVGDHWFNATVRSQ
ncbi:laccase-2 [Zalerion maritima]|uniref:Laccase-2 n=1 Tax=Zalerion maritima TaxID=339359 RepID=A0AAD5RFK9_9PEZI|nr:laccase-2 [Zalerion maritima]